MSEQNKIKVLVIEPSKKPAVREIESGLDSLQSIVGGYIEVVYPFEDNVALIVNEEGKLIDLPINRALFNGGEIYDVIFGTFIVVGICNSDFCSLTDALVEKYMKRFHHPEMFLQVGARLVALPYESEV